MGRPLRHRFSRASVPNGSHNCKIEPSDERSYRDNRNELGMTTPHNPVSTDAAIVTQSNDKPRDKDRRDSGGSHRKPRGRSPQPGPQRRFDPRGRSRERFNTLSHPSHTSSPSRDHARRGRHRGSSRGGPESDFAGDLRDLGAAKAPPQSHPHPLDRRHGRGASSSPSNKRRRSISPPPGASRSKKARRGRSPRRDKGLQKSSQKGSNHDRRNSGARDSRSPEPRRRHSNNPEKRHDRAGPPSAPRRGQSPSVSREGGPPDTIRGSDRRLSPPRRYRDRSPLTGPRPRSRSRQRSPHRGFGSRRVSRHSASPDSPSRRPSPDTHSRPTFAPSRSPRDGWPSRGRKNRKNREEKRPAKKFDPSSGANSVEVNMSARGGFRGPYSGQSGYSNKPGYNQSFSHSSGHGTPNSSYHGSPPPQSPYSASGRSYGQGQFSPQSQYPSQYPHGNFGPPTGPQNQFSHSPPYPPNGPSSQYPTGPGYRGGRGSGGFRGGQFSGRGGHRGNFKNTQWNSSSPRGGHGSNGATSRRASDDIEPAQGSLHPSPTRDESEEANENSLEPQGENPFRPSKDLQVEDTGNDKPELGANETMLPPNRPTPTGPQAQTNKFSFSMKSTSKPAVTAPRPEISSKFNAPPPRLEPPPKAPEKSERDRDRDRERDRDRDRDRERERERERDRGGLPKNVPTEPASARSRHHNNERRHVEPVKHSEPPPRTRKVKKIMKRLKQKPKLSVEMAASKSVYFRKPGNESVVGSGTYGKVFKGLNVYTKSLVALKKIRMEGERDGFPVTAVREVKLLRSLNHRNIVQLKEVMVETNECFMVFEYLSHDLTGLLNHPTYKLDMAQKKHLAQQFFEGLDYLHTRGVLHRDIKAANILVSNEGILKLADFGLARFYAKHHQLDYTNRVITIWYRSPELLLGETQYGPAVDIWSAACVFWEFFGQSAIFAGDGSEINQLDKIWSVLGTPNKRDWPNLTEMPWFELLRPAYRKANVFEQKFKDRVPSEAAFDLLKWMFHFDPAKRPTAAEVLQHTYFTKEEPAPRQAIELKNIEGDWHEFESKALRREKERQEREARRAAKEAAAAGSTRGDRDKKRPNETSDAPRESKRANLEGKARSMPPPAGPPSGSISNPSAPAFDGGGKVVNP